MENQDKNQKEISQQITSHPNGTKEKWKYIEKLSNAAPLFGVLFVIIYIFGFIIVNAHLSTFGFATFELLRGRYLGAGLSYTLAIILISLFIPIMEESFAISKTFKKKLAKVSMVIGSVLFAFVFANITLYYLLTLANMQSVSYSKLFSITDPRFLVFTGLSLTTIDNLLAIIFDKKDSLTTRSYSIAWWIPSLLLTVFIYGKGLYPSIPSVIGGGQPIRAEEILISTLDEKNHLNTTTIHNIDIIFEDENSFLFSVPKDSLRQVVLRKRSDVHHIIYQTTKTNSSPSQRKTPAPELKKEGTNEK